MRLAHEHQGNPGRVAEINARRDSFWEALEHELTPGEDEESPELLAAIDEGIHSLETGQKRYTIDELRQQVTSIERVRP